MIKIQMTPLMLDIANLYMNDKEQFIEQAKLYTIRYATEE